jgi:AcrR family transcriptional regulator
LDKRIFYKRNKILNTALKCFRQYGYSKCTLKDIAVKAGISRASLYLYFRNKKELFITITNELHEEYYIESREILESDKSDKQKIKDIIDVWIVNPYQEIIGSPHSNDWLDELVHISAQSEMRFRKLFMKSIAPLTGIDSAEVIVLAIRGLLDDRPPLKVLNRRIGILIDCLC